MANFFFCGKFAMQEGGTQTSCVDSTSRERAAMLDKKGISKDKARSRNTTRGICRLGVRVHKLKSDTCIKNISDSDIESLHSDDLDKPNDETGHKFNPHELIIIKYPGIDENNIRVVDKTMKKPSFSPEKKMGLKIVSNMSREQIHPSIRSQDIDFTLDQSLGEETPPEEEDSVDYLRTKQQSGINGMDQSHLPKNEHQDISDIISKASVQLSNCERSLTKEIPKHELPFKNPLQQQKPKEKESATHNNLTSTMPQTNKNYQLQLDSITTEEKVYQKKLPQAKVKTEKKNNIRDERVQEKERERDIEKINNNDTTAQGHDKDKNISSSQLGKVNNSTISLFSNCSNKEEKLKKNLTAKITNQKIEQQSEKKKSREEVESASEITTEGGCKCQQNNSVTGNNHLDQLLGSNNITLDDLKILQTFKQFQALQELQNLQNLQNIQKLQQSFQQAPAQMQRQEQMSVQMSMTMPQMQVPMPQMQVQLPMPQIQNIPSNSYSNISNPFIQASAPLTSMSAPLYQNIAVQSSHEYYPLEKDPNSCTYCEDIYKFTIMNNLPLKMMTCLYCNKQMNAGSLEFYLNKYKDELEDQYKSKLASPDPMEHSLAMTSSQLEYQQMNHNDNYNYNYNDNDNDSINKIEHVEENNESENENENVHVNVNPEENEENLDTFANRGKSMDYNLTDRRRYKEESSNMILDTTDTQMSLAEVFKMRRANLMKKMEKRASSVKESADQISDIKKSENMEMKNIHKILQKRDNAMTVNSAKQSFEASSFLDLNKSRYSAKAEPSPDVMDRLIHGKRLQMTQKEMKEVNKRMYKKLVEVKYKVKEDHKKEDIIKRNDIKKEYTQKLKENVVKKKKSKV